MIVGVPRETLPGERRVAVIPAALPVLSKAKLQVWVERGAGLEAGYGDAAYEERGAKIVDATELFAGAAVVLQVNGPSLNPQRAAQLAAMRSGQVAIGLFDPLSAPERIREIAARGITAFSMELIPRITRAQVMDVLSSMATVAGYKAVLLAASALPRMFPMLMTAAGTLSPAKVLVIGAGVAGLQAIATAKRLGAKIEAYDVRPAVKEQIESLGARFVELDLETMDAQDQGGYAKAQSEDFYRRQQQLLGEVVAKHDVVIATAAVPGKKAPVLITESAVRQMAPGSVVVDLAAERGGNCELTESGRTVVVHGVTLIGPENLAATVPFHASQMYSKNVTSFLLHLVQDGALAFDTNDEITAGTLLTRDGSVVHPRIRELLDSSQ